MNHRRLGKTNFNISEISLGTWQVGGKWGSGFDDANAETILNAASDHGVNFIDTADVYEDRQSEAAVARVVKQRSERIYVATKCGKFIDPHINENYTVAALRGYVEASLQNTGFETIDLIQLHCPPSEVYDRPEIFGLFEDLKSEGKILNLGVSVERIAEATKAIEYANVTTVQIIFNIFRQRPADDFFKLAAQKDIGIIVRVPLASGLLTGKFSASSTFAAGDHRNFNRDGEAFDKGETFSGIPFDIGLETVEQLKSLVPTDADLAALALRWILDHEQVSTIIPGVSKIEQLHSNLRASATAPLGEHRTSQINEIYTEKIKPLVHHLW